MKGNGENGFGYPPHSIFLGQGFMKPRLASNSCVVEDDSELLILLPNFWDSIFYYA